MISDDRELKVTLERINWFQNQVVHLRATEKNPGNYHAAVEGFLAEIERMQSDVREYLSRHPEDLPAVA